MAKVFISFLGVNQYSKVNYVYSKDEMVEGEPVRVEIKTPTRYVQIASVNAICRAWTDSDRIVIFRTKGSDAVNWNTAKNGVGLKTELSNLLESWKSHGTVPTLNPGEDENPGNYIVPNGFNQEELWGIFNKVFDNIDDKDEIYFDMTHAFRTIPLFTTVLFNYCRFMKDSIVKEVLYGAFEELSEHNDLRNMDPKDKEKLDVRLVDLTEVVRMQDMNDAVSSFKQFGDMGSIIKILERERRNNASNPNVNAILLNNTIYEIQQALGQLNLYTQTCNLNKLYEGKYVRSIYRQIGTIKNSKDIPEPQKKLLLKIREKLSSCGFESNKSHKNIEAAVNWLVRNNMIQQAVTLASEYIKDTYYRLYDSLYHIPKLPEVAEERKAKAKAKDLISYILTHTKVIDSDRLVKFSDDNWQSKLEEETFTQQNVLEFIQIKSVANIQPHYDSLRRMRNKMNHADEVESRSLNNLRNTFETKIWKKCLDLLNTINEGCDNTSSMDELWKSES